MLQKTSILSFQKDQCGRTVPWTWQPDGSKAGAYTGNRGGTIQKAIWIDGVNSCANIYLFTPSLLEDWLILHILKTEVFIIEIKSNTFKVRNGNSVCLFLCVCIQPITKMNYSSYEKKIPLPSFIATHN